MRELTASETRMVSAGELVCQGADGTPCTGMTGTGLLDTMAMLYDAAVGAATDLIEATVNWWRS